MHAHARACTHMHACVPMRRIRSTQHEAAAPVSARRSQPERHRQRGPHGLEEYIKLLRRKRQLHAIVLFKLVPRAAVGARGGMLRPRLARLPARLAASRPRVARCVQHAEELLAREAPRRGCARFRENRSLRESQVARGQPSCSCAMHQRPAAAHARTAAHARSRPHARTTCLQLFHVHVPGAGPAALHTQLRAVLVATASAGEPQGPAARVPERVPERVSREWCRPG